MSEPDRATIDLFRRNETEIRRLHARLRAFFRERDRDNASNEAWRQAAYELRDRYDQLAFPGGVWAMTVKLKAGDPSIIDDALTFLELRPYFFRLGYLHQMLRKKLGRLPMNEMQLARYEVVKERWRKWREISVARRHAAKGT